MKALTEAQWTRHVEDALTATGWRWCLTMPAKRSHNGAPDIIAVRPPRTLALELKRETWRGATTEQADWLRALNGSGVEAHLVTLPKDWHRLEDIIARPPIQESWTSNSTSATLVTANNEGT